MFFFGFSNTNVKKRKKRNHLVMQPLIQGSQDQEVKFQDPIFRKFQNNFRTFLSVSRGSRVKTQKMHVFLSS